MQSRWVKIGVAVAGVLVVGVAAWLLLKPEEKSVVAAPVFDINKAELVIKPKSKKGEPRRYNDVEVYFVGNGPAATHVQQARECMRTLRADYDQIKCYSFPTLAAYQFAEVNPKNGKMRRDCWGVRWEYVRNDDGSYSGNAVVGNVKAEYDKCPSYFSPGTNRNWVPSS